MKFIFFKCIIIWSMIYATVASDANTSRQTSLENYSFKMNVNDEADMFLTRITEIMKNKSLDPYVLKDITQKFQYKSRFFKHTCVLNLHEGVVYNISQMKRDGNVDLTITETATTVHLPITYAVIHFNYKYNLSVMGMRPKGTVSGRILDPKIHLVASADWKSYHVKLLSFEVVSAGRIKIKFGGHRLFDWLVGVVSNTMAKLLHGDVVRAFSSLIKRQFEDYVGEINQYTSTHPNETAQIVSKVILG